MKSVSLITGGLSFLLSACSGGGGSFDVDDVSNPSSSKPRYQDDTSNQRKKSDLQKLSIPSLGGGMKLVAQNLLGKREPSFLNNEDGYMIFSSLSTIKDDVEKVKKEKKVDTNPIGRIDEPNEKPKDSNSQKYVYSGLYYINSWSDVKRLENKAYIGYYGYAFYYGNKTATDLPVSGVAKYKGTWSFITATERGKSYSLFGSGSGAYNKRSAISEDIDNLENNPRDAGLTSEFTVDFGTKKLTGELYYNERETNLNTSKNRKHKLYDLEADVHSNRFRGKVKPTKEEESQEHPFTSEGTLEGGFYGPNAEELGGKFLAKDKRVFGVFSAKEQSETPENKALSRETLIDGKLITFSTKKTDATTSTTTNTAADATANTENFTTKDIPSFGEADYLLIDNYPVPLLPEENTNDFISSKHHEVKGKRYKVEACCSNLSYVKFGMYYEDPLKEEEKNKEKEKEKKDKEKEDKEKQATTSIKTYYQFLLGLRTPSSQIPKEGSAQYRGSWFGYLSDGSTSYSTSGDEKRDKNALAEFNVNFAEKKLTGELKRHDTGNTVFSIEANFNNSGNAFKGTARANDVAIDSQNTQTTSRVNFTATVNGAFYGPHATELGGYFTYNGKDTITKNSESSPAVSSSSNSEKARAAVVFGAKKQVETTNK
ncbi:TPA: transferrin-binding protein-like solute binding protein [Haemophilus influenzae]|uniref:transferrin-binding protein-like solute binding protein n=1 Tax=Haemophilus influenzae TaxID=727 RepID=UPI000CFEC5C9|nr:transferrin-binding protein-like solute binding protein [Haemophilus influenzae]MCK8995361.1 transferrin-binding protein-like solute binding protein [Haemophilus influenzae]MCK9633137.1 transferrin-binding protein-like solute binding protein [Haemophilus influenzae]MDO7273416.1 transferrin-binding protein-like solute binding protein [Haemophilus influenzae]MDU6702183.1 transferrin-binding protein-like solute binding protein [Haemophilus influenzae]PRJ46092.1 Transferrin-binding protein 2 pr